VLRSLDGPAGQYSCVVEVAQSFDPPAFREISM